MELYEPVIKEIRSLLKDKKASPLEIHKDAWKDAGRTQMFFLDETAYELGGSGHQSISTIAFSSEIQEDAIFLVGKDLNAIKEDHDFGRIAILGIDEARAGEGSTLYQNLRKADYVRYHLNPEGYMMLISAKNQRENVRVSKKALQNGLSFDHVGNMFLQEYHKLPFVIHVHLYFITEDDFPYEQLRCCAVLSDNITKTLDHLTNHVKMDCQTCGLQKICADVQDLYERDFGHRLSRS